MTDHPDYKALYEAKEIELERLLEACSDAVEGAWPNADDADPPAMIKHLRALYEAAVAEADQAASLLGNLAQIIDVVRQEWAAENNWSDWDAEQRRGITAWLTTYHARAERAEASIQPSEQFAENAKCSGEHGELVERVARAIAAAKRAPKLRGPEVIDKIWRTYCGQARAAIAALSRPVEEGK